MKKKILVIGIGPGIGLAAAAMFSSHAKCKLTTSIPKKEDTPFKEEPTMLITKQDLMPDTDAMITSKYNHPFGVFFQKGNKKY